MSASMRIFDIPKRPDPRLVAELGKMVTPHLSDSMERLYAGGHPLRPMHKEGKLAGPALQVFLQNSEIKVDELVPKLQAITQARGGLDERIYVRGDRKVDYGSVMRVMGRISSAGFRRVALVTEIEQGR